MKVFISEMIEHYRALYRKKYFQLFLKFRFPVLRTQKKTPAVSADAFSLSRFLAKGCLPVGFNQETTGRDFRALPSP
jgi:hypothetical protein